MLKIHAEGVQVVCGMDILGTSFFNVYKPNDTRVPFRRGKDEVIKWKVHTYRYGCKGRCDWAITFIMLFKMIAIRIINYI